MTKKMTYTGERMVPEEADINTFWEHIYRYRFALAHVQGRRVLDIACGEGYGAAALQQAGAVSLTGVDISLEACEHASKRYGIQTKLGDAKKIPLPDKSLDVVVSFETIEHTDNPNLFLDECARVLAPGGKLVISTPNLDSRDASASKNPFHLKELSAEEFVAALKNRFQTVEIFTQRPKTVAWWSARSLAANQAAWQRIPGFGRFRKLLQWFCCPEIQSVDRLNAARANPVQAILAGQNEKKQFCNPFSVREYQPTIKEVPVYFIAVASL
jgi:2-polyprenyl-3-methyl-5-hydroxy-6-metoxy-1,4-benzoquinol methylase